MKWWIQTCLALAAAGALVALGWAWRSERQARITLELQLRTANAAIAHAEQRQQARAAEVHRRIAALEKKRRSVRSPEQIGKQLPLELRLPKPLQIEPARAGALVPEHRRAAADSPREPPSMTPGARPNSPAPKIVLPPEDLKPLYDFTVDCQECNAKLDAAEQDLADERIKSAALARQRDAALKAARGGSLMDRIGRVAKWLLIGAAAGAIAAEAAHSR